LRPKGNEGRFIKEGGGSEGGVGVIGRVEGTSEKVIRNELGRRRGEDWGTWKKATTAWGGAWENREPHWRKACLLREEEKRGYGQGRSKRRWNLRRIGRISAASATERGGKRGGGVYEKTNGGKGKEKRIRSA